MYSICTLFNSLILLQGDIVQNTDPSTDGGFRLQYIVFGNQNNNNNNDHKQLHMFGSFQLKIDFAFCSFIF